MWQKRNVPCGLRRSTYSPTLGAKHDDVGGDHSDNHGDDHGARDNEHWGKCGSPLDPAEL